MLTSKAPARATFSIIPTFFLILLFTQIHLKASLPRQKYYTIQDIPPQLLQKTHTLSSYLSSPPVPQEGYSVYQSQDHYDQVMSFEANQESKQNEGNSNDNSNENEGKKKGIKDDLPKFCDFMDINIVMNSGHFINDMGYFKTCRKTKGFRYVKTAIYKIGPIKQLQIGMCLDVRCDTDKLQTYYQNQVWDYFKKNNYDLRPPVFVTPIEFREMSVGAYGFLGLLLVLVIVSAVGTYITQKAKRRIDEHERLKKSIEKEEHMRLSEGQNKIKSALAPSNEDRDTVQPADPKHRTTLGNSPPLPSHFWAMFDIPTNYKSITETRRISSSVQVFELLRVMAMVWIVFAHELVQRVPISQNYTDANIFNEFSKSWLLTFVETGYYAVDIFLFIGGYVNVLANTKFLKLFLGGGFMRYPMVYLYTIFKRYCRIMPAYAFMLFYYYQVAPLLQRGPMGVAAGCNSTNFWESFLLGYKSGFVDGSLCAGWCWYLAVDFQLFLTVPFLCWIFIYSKRLAIYTCYLLILTTMTITIWFSLRDNVYWMNYDNNYSLTKYYTISYMRGMTYYMGTLVAMFSMPSSNKRSRRRKSMQSTDSSKKNHDNKEENKENSPVEPPQDLSQINPIDEPLNPSNQSPPQDSNTLHSALLRANKTLKEKKEAESKDNKRKAKKNLIMTIAGLLSFASVAGESLLLHYYFQFGLGAEYVSLTASVMFLTFSKIFFLLGLIGVLLVIAQSSKAFTLFIAKNKLVQLIGNVSFAMYLFHYTVIVVRSQDFESLPYYGTYDLFMQFCADFFFTFLLAVVTALLVELPAQSMWKIYAEASFVRRFKVDLEAKKRQEEERIQKMLEGSVDLPEPSFQNQQDL